MTLRGNLDAPKAALDALLQSVVCIEVGLILVRCFLLLTLGALREGYCSCLVCVCVFGEL